jgi:hypothetical protein
MVLLDLSIVYRTCREWHLRDRAVVWQSTNQTEAYHCWLQQGFGAFKSDWLGCQTLFIGVPEIREFMF